MAFFECYSLGRMIFPETLKEISYDAFGNCINLTRAEFNGDTELVMYAFSDCKHLQEIVFYKNPTNINEYAFTGVPELTLFSENSLYVDEFAQRKKMQSENIKNLPPYKDLGLLEEKQEELENQGFSAIYTLILIAILIVDLAIVVLFSFYILVSEKRSRRRKRAQFLAERKKRKALAASSAASSSDSGDDTIVYAYATPKKQRISSLKQPSSASERRSNTTERKEQTFKSPNAQHPRTRYPNRSSNDRNDRQ